LQDVLLAYRRLLLRIEPEDSWIPPYDRSPAGTRHVEARSNRSSWRRNALTSAIQHAVVAEGWTSGCGAGCAFGALRRIKDRLEWVEPASDRRITADRRDQQISGACGSHVGNSHGFGSVATQFLVRGLQELDWRAAAEWFKPPPPDGVDMPSGHVARHLTGGIGEDDDGKLESLCLVDGHDSDALGAFFHDGRLVRLSAIRVCLHLLDEGAKR
jgi:hypothetical protein